MAPGRTQQERKQVRRAFGKLVDQLIQPKTRDRYADAFQRFCRFHELRIDFQLPPPDVFDDMVGSYIEHLWEEGAPKSDASYVVAAVQFHRPQSKHHLPWSWRLTKAWNHLELPCRATPFSPDLALAMAGQAFQWKQPRMGWLLVLGFSLFLRTGEILQLKVKDISFPSNGSKDAPVVYLSSTKTTKKNLLPLEAVVVEEEISVKALQQLCKGLQPGDTLSQVSSQSFRKLFHRLLEALGLTSLGFAPYSLRRGGATSAFRAGASLDVLVTKGRWQNVSTARIYLDESAQALAALKIPRPSMLRCTKAKQYFVSVSQGGTRGKGPI